MEIDNKFDIEQVVYLKTDIEQTPRLVTAIEVSKSSLVYKLSCGASSSWHSDFEISDAPNNLNAKIKGFKIDSK